MMFSVQKTSLLNISAVLFIKLFLKMQGIKNIEKKLKGGGWITSSAYPHSSSMAIEYLSMNWY